MTDFNRLPWDDDPRDRLRFRVLWVGLLVFTLVAGIWLASVQLPDRPRAEREKLPPQLARVLLEKKKVTPPPPPEPEAPKPEKPKPKPKPEKKVTRPEPKPEPRPVAKVPPKPETTVKPPPTEQEIEKAREVAKQTGLLAEADELNDLRDLVADVSPLLDAKPVASASTRDVARASSEKLVTEARTGTSGGLADLNLKQAGTSRETLAQRQQAQVSAPVEPGEAESGSQVASAQKASAGRSSEEIRRVFDASKGSIMRIYTRALRKNPALEGRFVPELTIESNGKVSTCKVITSELDDAALEKSLCRRLQLLDFGKKPDAPKQVVRYTFDFLPS
ncbi:MAG: hypothetical protein D6758_00050 [Gammaproteobacteria bacterium]|nr:MAG: hypothetical protein D6758_00050 [Gammaproteobacteria bacterium]